MNRLCYGGLSTLIAYAYRYKIQRTYTGAVRLTLPARFLWKSLFGRYDT
jgi:hypothetical protein